MYSAGEGESDLEAVRADGYHSRDKNRVKGGGKRGREEEQEEGVIERVSRKMMDKRSGSNISSTNSSSGMGGKKKSVRMFELADGVTTSGAVFGASEEAKMARRQERQQANLPISERIRAGGDRGGRKGGIVEGDQKMRYMRTKAKGLVREMSFMPEEKKKKGSAELGRRDRGGSPGKKFSPRGRR